MRITPRFLAWATRCIEMPFAEIGTTSEKFTLAIPEVLKREKGRSYKLSLALPIDE